ncbi:hypothetical protein BX600DRAFT_477437 [Xylariales sp. PMI_506]|nr:hypothetical protein BX600DRAFT_477437 [Xylariales sp. PMI_506]
MFVINIILLISTYTKLVKSFPTPEFQIPLESRCGTFLAPTGMYLLDEDQPDTFFPVTNNLFQIYQEAGLNDGTATGRQYILVHFPPTPYGSTGCELKWDIPTGTQFTSYYGGQQLDVKTTRAYSPPFRPTWNNVVAGDPPTLGPGVFGTVNAVAGTSTFVNTEACSNRAPEGEVGGGFGLSFVFKFASWIEQNGAAAGLGFYCGNSGTSYTGPSINYNC